MSEAYQSLFKQLGQLIEEGKGDDEEADALRDQMDTIWYSLNEDELCVLINNINEWLKS